MEIPVRFAYLALNVGFGILWSIFFVFFPRTRKIQLQISLFAAPLGPLIEYLYFQDYWCPMSSLPEINLGPFRVLFEDFAFAFFFTGITGMLAHITGTGRKEKDFRLKMPMQLVVIYVVSLLLSFPFIYFGLNSIFVTSISFLSIAGLTALAKKGIWPYALRCGFSTVLAMFVIYFIIFHLTSNTEELYKSIWLIYDYPVLGMRFLNIPITELVWGFAWGNMMGAVRHYLYG
jgi:hypothetical protein